MRLRAAVLNREIERMYASSTPLVPDQFHDRDFAPRDLDAERDLRNQRIRRPQRQGPVKRASITSRILRSAIRFVATILIGVGLTLLWQSHSDELSALVADWAPSLAWLMPSQPPKQTAETAAASEVAQQIKLIAIDLAIVRRNVGQLAANQDQFAAKQERFNQSLATLQQVEQDVRDQMLSAPAPKAAHPPAHVTPQTSPR
jgi:hypothetical protein